MPPTTQRPARKKPRASRPGSGAARPSPSSLLPSPAWPQAERVHAYARDVVAGRIRAGRYVRAACQRHLDDLQRPDLVWKPAAAEAWLTFFQSLNLDDGVPFRLMDHQAFKVGSITGWHRPDGRRRYRIAYIEEGKGNGKTPLAAGFALGGLTIDVQPSPDIYLAAAAKEQARICLRDVTKIVHATPHISRVVEVLTNNISMPTRHGRIQTLSSEDKVAHGLRVHIGVLDEIHAHGSARMVNVIEAGTKNNKNSLILLITNSGSDRLGPCWAYHTRAEEMLAGGKPDDEFFAYVATLDPCPRCQARGKKQVDLRCPKCDDWRDLDTLAKANPSLGGPFYDRDYLARRIAVAQKMPSKLNEVLQLNCCIWTESDAGWLDMQSWRQHCHAPGLRLEDFKGRPCWIGMDAANLKDATCKIRLFELAPGTGTLDPATLPEAAREALREATGQSPDPSAQTPDPRPQTPDPAAALAAAGYAIFLTTYVPRALVQNSAHANAEAYAAWAAAGHLVVTDGGATDFDRIEADLRQDAEDFDVVRLQADIRELNYFLQRVQAWATFELVTVPQGPATISAPMKMFEALVAAGLMQHDGNPVLDWMLGNIELKTTRTGGPVKFYYPTRSAESKKIDAGPAAFMALDAALRTPATQADPGMIVLG